MITGSYFVHVWGPRELKLVLDKKKYQFMTPYATKNLVTLLPLCLEDFRSITLHCWIWLHLFGLRENNYLWEEKKLCSAILVIQRGQWKVIPQLWAGSWDSSNHEHITFVMCSLTCQCLLRNLFYIIRPHLFLARPCIHDSPFSKFVLPCICPLHIIIIRSC